jgi:deoxycytidine triphosphate deaminase
MTERQQRLFSSDKAASGILIDTEIQDSVTAGSLIVHSTFSPASLEASSYDIRVGARGVVGGDGTELDLRREPMELQPGAYGGVVSMECFDLPGNISARIGSKRALSYEGVILLTGSTVDPGYRGHLLFGIYNASQRKVIIRSGRKLCNVVFEKLSAEPEKLVPSDPNLASGSFPDAFLDRMANMDVLPWMQISERVKQIETITKDIIDLKSRYEDVLKPIRDLTDNVVSLTKDVSSLANQTKSIAKDVEDVSSLVSENGRQITQLTANLGVLGANMQGLQQQAGRLERSDADRQQAITTLRTSFGRTQLLSYIFWAIVLLVAGGFVTTVFDRLMKK